MAFLYYGISFRISGFGVSIYLTQFIYGAIKAPAKILTFFVLDWAGRRNGQAWFLITTGALIGINTAIPLGDITSCLCIQIDPIFSYRDHFDILDDLLLFQSSLCFERASLWWRRVSQRRRSPQRSSTQLNSTQLSSGKTLNLNPRSTLTFTYTTFLTRVIGKSC